MSIMTLKENIRTPVLGAFLWSIFLHGGFAQMPGQNASQTPEPMGKSIFNQTATGIDVHYYRPELEVSDQSTFITGKTTILASAETNLDQVVLSLISDMIVDSVWCNGTPATALHSGDTLYITLNATRGPGDQLEMVVWYHGTVPAAGFFSGMTTGRDNTWQQDVTWTLSEPFSAADWFPCKQDLTDKADSCSVWVTVANGLKAGANGILAGVDTLHNNKVRYRWEHRHPIDYYLISLAVSAYDEFTFKVAIPPDGDSVRVVNYIYPGNAFFSTYEDEIRQTGDFLQLFSDLLIPYPFADEKYGHCVAPMGGGMEHQTMTTLVGFNFGIVAHELFHQWFGDYVTCATWQDIWINEGFASYGEYLAWENLGDPQQADDWMENAHARAMLEPSGSVYIPFEEASDVYRIFSGNLSYKKGAAIIHMLRYEIDSDSLFFRSLQRFLELYGNSVATGGDFRNTVETVTGDDYTWFFDQWYYGQGYPRLSLAWSQTGDSLFLNLQQTATATATPFFRMHLDLLLHTNSGDTLVRVLQEAPNQTIVLQVGQEIQNITVDPEHRLLLEVTGIAHVPQESTGREMVLYPNPSEDELTILLLHPLTEMQIMIVDLQGKVVRQFTGSGQRIVLPLTGLPNGVYMIRIRSGNQVLKRKFVISRQ